MYEAVAIHTHAPANQTRPNQTKPDQTRHTDRPARPASRKADWKHVPRRAGQRPGGGRGQPRPCPGQGSTRHVSAIYPSAPNRCMFFSPVQAASGVGSKKRDGGWVGRYIYVYVRVARARAGGKSGLVCVWVGERASLLSFFDFLLALYVFPSVVCLFILPAFLPACLIFSFAGYYHFISLHFPLASLFLFLPSFLRTPHPTPPLPFAFSPCVHT
ncbi:uncharacterized protein K452DRAFT_141022 [Aplosporella prunicola CBS 121167]|uniref:Uncharacterized protein n=1 Tax=Aplosporella prunicola CBS 121167 TaxID=1176127 RepID=A0A6A6BK11_9PEZI|nr:uncharacterized protein K452DRAFT_141022 [Aplosporella prunicola CBS 121167]KAF2144366.1 hypothetical protein K452DRAFT_141022 [Aplosporella prunicola CBS 121167]